MEAAPNKRSYVRLAAIRALLKGHERSLVCDLYDCTDRCVRLWIERFNQGGISSLISRPRLGRPRKVKLERVRDLLLPVLEDPTKAGEVHWTGVKIHGYLQEQFSLELGYRTAIRWLHEMGFNLRVPQPWPERQDPVERERFKRELEQLCADPSIELWFSDECGVEGDPRPRRRWVERGKRATVPYLGDHIRQNVIGAVAPQTGKLFALIMDGVDGHVFQFFLDEMAKSVPRVEGKRQILFVDNASWHVGSQLDWHHFEPRFLPKYSPDYNPIERLWLRIKSDWFADFIAHTPQELTDRLCLALNSFMNDPTKTASNCSIRK